MSLPQRMTRHVQEYLALRRAFGFRLSIAGEQLESFARFADSTGRGKVLTIDLALRWAQSSSTGKQTTAARRLLILRPFARYLQTIEPLTEIPPNRILGPAQYRHIPHIYTNEEIRSLLDAAADLRPQGGLRARSFRTYVSLMLCTGMRPPEPLRLTRADVDAQAHTITVRQTKFSKSRIVVLHPTATNALREYERARDRRVALTQSSAFFLCDDGTAFTHKKALWAFGFFASSAELGSTAGLPTSPPIRYSSHFCLPSPSRVVSTGCGCSRGYTCTVDVPGARQGHRYVLVCNRNPRIDEHHQRTF